MEMLHTNGKLEKVRALVAVEVWSMVGVFCMSQCWLLLVMQFFWKLREARAPVGTPVDLPESK